MILDPSELGRLVAAAKPSILTAFVEHARRDVPGARGESRPYLEDHLGAVVEEVGAYLASDGAPDVVANAARLGHLHGRERARSEHYTLEDLRHELRILRALLLGVVPAGRGLSVRAASLFGDVYDRCVSRSTEAFLRASSTELGTHAALRESQAALEFTLASANLGTWSIDFTAGGALSVSPETVAMFGLNPAYASVDGAIVDHVHPDDRDRVRRLLSETTASGTAYADEYRVLAPDGTIRWVDVRGRVEHDAQGKLKKLSGVVLDSTERKRAEARLLASNRMLHLAAAGGRVGFWHVHTEHGTFDPDARMALDWGIDLSTFARTFEAGMALVHPEDRHVVSSGLGRARAGGDAYDEEFRVVHPSGEERWIRATGELHADADGRRTLFSGVSIDITDRKRGQLSEQKVAAAVARERRLLEEVLEQTPIPTALLTGPDHVFAFANTAYLRTFDIGADLIGRSVREVLPDAIEQGFGQLLDHVFRTGERFAGSEVLFERTSDAGTARYYLDFSYVAKRDAAGRIEGILVTAVDVTDRVRLRREIEQANERLRAEKAHLDEIFRVSPAAMATWSGESLIFQQANPTFSRIYGDRPLIGRTLLEACPELEGQGFDDLLRRVMTTGEPFVGTETLAKVAQVPGGPTEDRYYDFVYVRLHDEKGRPSGVYDFALDVTDRVLANRATAAATAKLRDTERLLQRAIQVAEIGFYDWDLESNAVTFSPQMQADWGIDAGTTLEQILTHVDADDRERVSAAIRRSVSGGERFAQQYRVHRPTDGRVVWIEAQGEMTTDEATGARHFIGTSLDVTNRKLDEERLRTVSLEASNANLAKSAFLANMSHEIRTPLGAIMGFAELLRNPDVGAGDTLSFASAIERNSAHLLRIVDDILDLSKVEAGKMLFERIEFSLVDLLSDFASLMAFRAREKGIDFSLHYDTALPELVSSDPTRLRQILGNVVGNALKFTERGSVELRVRCDGDKLVFAVHDTGRGLTTEQAARLFHAFVQADESTTRQFGGTGLGLVLTRRLANAMGGDFVLERSEPGVGSTFVATVVVEVTPHASTTHPRSRHTSDEQARASDRQRLRGIRVLVVDDSPDNRTFLSTMLRTSGASVDCASDGAEGVTMALATRYDAILMDIQMPKLDGYQALAALQAEQCPTPIIALTAHAMVEERARAESKGFVAFLTKPIRSDVLVDLVADLRPSGANVAVAEPRDGARRRRALVVEDDEDTRWLLEHILATRGFEVLAAADGAQAQRVLDTGARVDLVLVDLSLPDVSGEDVVRAVRASEAARGAKIVVASGWDDLQRRARAIEADEALSKPLEMASLKKMLAAMFPDGAA